MTRNDWIVGTLICMIGWSALLSPSSHAQTDRAEALKVTIGPISAIIREERGWTCELPIRIHNISKESLYVPNPLDLYMSFPLRFFLRSPDQQRLRETKMERLPVLFETAWIRMDPNDVVAYSKPMILLNGPGFHSTDLTQQERLNAIIFAFILEEWKEMFQTAILYAEMSYPKPYQDWEQEWLRMQEPPYDDMKPVTFWHGEITSNVLNIDLSTAVEKTE